MADVQGMKVEDVEQLAHQLDAQAQRLEATVKQVDGVVGHLTSVWRGQDAVAFHGWWTEQHRPALVVAISSVAGLATSAKNNAFDQAKTSSTAGAVGAAAAAAGAAGAAAVAHSGSSGSSGNSGGSGHSGPASSGAAQVSSFAKKWNGKYLDYDHEYRNQCYDVFSEYNHDVVGATDIHAGTTGGAKDIYNDFATNGAAKYYDRYAASAGPPHVGDVVVWGNGQYGHVAIVTAVQGSSFTVLEENANGMADVNVNGVVQNGSLTQLSTKSMNDSSLLGFLRPKSFK